MKVCTKCGVAKELSEFYNHPTGKEGRQPRCKECQSKEWEAWSKTPRGRAYQKTRDSERNLKVNRRRAQRLRKLRLKLECLEAYGGAFCHYEGCGITDIRLLTLSHVNNDGAEHRERILGTTRTSGGFLYGTLRRLNYPKDVVLAVECYNHNILHSYARRDEELVINLFVRRKPGTAGAVSSWGV
jgi:hypothetical protein